MTKSYGQIIAYMSQPEEDGSVVIQVANAGSEPLDVRIEPQDVPKLLGVLQRAMMQKPQGSGQEIALQEVTIDHIQLGFGGGEVAVVVSTDQIGTIALQGNEEGFRVLSTLAEQAAEFISTSRH